jgi:hypothetical protein
MATSIDLHTRSSNCTLPMRKILPVSCARAASGHAAAPPRSVMNARRRMAHLPLQRGASLAEGADAVLRRDLK